ncbi:hypothetical protein DSO57_1036706, partial [Entomophthora muscae]
MNALPELLVTEKHNTMLLSLTIATIATNKGISQKDALLLALSARALTTVTTAVPITSVPMCSAPL